MRVPRRSLWAVLAIVVLVLGTVIVGRQTASSARGSESFTLRVRLDRISYGTGETVRVTRQVCSRAWWWRETATLPPAWRIADGDGTAAEAIYADLLRLPAEKLTWWPRQCRSWTDEWDQQYLNPTPAEDERLARVGQVRAGPYRLFAHWQGLADGPVSFKITG